MTTPYPLDDNLYVAGQLDPADFAAAAKMGITCIINNRPDHEDRGQMTADEGRALAAEHGLGYVHLPVTATSFSPDIVAAFADALEKADGPVLAHCKSGARSAVLWALGVVMRGALSHDEAVRRAAQCGIDITRPLGLLDRWRAV
ncbi:MAG: TIGR01244 family sulfur transferase [Pseudomonadota bacterium]